MLVHRTEISNQETVIQHSLKMDVFGIKADITNQVNIDVGYRDLKNLSCAAYPGRTRHSSPGIITLRGA